MGAISHYGGIMTKRTKMLTREDFLSVRKELVEVPELGGSVYVKELGGKSLLKYKERIEKLQEENPELDESNSLELMALLVSLTVCDKDGNLLFSESDVKKLAENHINVLIRLSTKALEMIGMSNTQIQEVQSKLPNARVDSSTIN